MVYFPPTRSEIQRFQSGDSKSSTASTPLWLMLAAASSATPTWRRLTRPQSCRAAVSPSSSVTGGENSSRRRRRRSSDGAWPEF